MRATGALSQPPQLAVHPRAKSTLTRIAQWTLYIAGALAIVLGVSVWPGHVHALGNVHGLAGWLVIASLWTLAATGARDGATAGGRL